jgi:hypothetical protein
MTANHFFTGRTFPFFLFLMQEFLYAPGPDIFKIFQGAQVVMSTVPPVKMREIPAGICRAFNTVMNLFLE